jgi:putative endonuclease
MEFNNPHLLVSGSMVKQPAVYILASKLNGTLYTGVTSDLVSRVWRHKNLTHEGFTKKYRVHTLVWYELHPTMETAIRREKEIKNWRRKWKLEMISNSNPTWDDLYPAISGATADYHSVIPGLLATAKALRRRDPESSRAVAEG